MAGTEADMGGMAEGEAPDEASAREALLEK